MYNCNLKLVNFVYKNHSYPSGTKLIYNGHCYLNNMEIYINNEIVTWLSNESDGVHLLKDGATYICPSWEFEKRIVKIIDDNSKIQASDNKKTEIYWTDDMVAKTLWYIIVMLVAIIFKDCIGIWILATIVWYNSTFKNKK